MTVILPPAAPRFPTIADYDHAADEYQQSLTIENLMEATPQATQRKITLESFDLLAIQRPGVQCYNELLVMEPFVGPSGKKEILRVCPDNMLVLSAEPIEDKGYYVIEHHHPIFMVLEYVSPNGQRKDYELNFRKYEAHIRPNYALIFDPDRNDLRIFRHDGKSFVILEKNANGRFEIPEIELEVALLDGWTRFWHQQELLDLTGELGLKLRESQASVRRMDTQLRRKDAELAKKSAELQKRDAEQERVLGLLQKSVRMFATLHQRQDILDALPTTTDIGQLDRWLNELGE